MTTTEKFDYLEEMGIATTEFIDGAICVGGYNDETAERVLFYHTGYRTFEQYEECEEED